MTSAASNDQFLEPIERALEAYDEPTLRQVAGKLYRPRNQWPAEELRRRCIETLSNAPVIDRRLKELPIPSRGVLRLIAQSRQPYWPVGSLVEWAMTLGAGDGLEAIRTLLESGVLYPQLRTGGNGLVIRGIETWLTQTSDPQVYAPPFVTQRTLREPLPLDVESLRVEASGPAIEADGLEWPLRLAIVHQQVSANPLRRTQTREFFKRDLERLRSDALLGTQPGESLVEIADPGLLAVGLANAVGALDEQGGDLFAGIFPEAWDKGHAPALAEIYASLWKLRGWTPLGGWDMAADASRPLASATLFALSLLSHLPDEAWADPRKLETWVLSRHPFWASKPPAEAGIAAFLLGLAPTLRLVQTCKLPEGGYAVRLSPLGRWILGMHDAPPAFAEFPKTLLVQPNLEILAYRQGLSPGLIFRLSRFALWKTLGAACTLQLEPTIVYRGLESGESLESLLQTLDRYGMKSTPTPVIEALRTWSNKRERITVYPSAALFEFATPEDLAEALSRGLPAQRLTDRVAVVASEGKIDYKNFRLTGTRDYCLPPERCVDVEEDGVTLNIDMARSDLLLETELQRFAEPLDRGTSPARKSYRLTPASLRQARQRGVTIDALTEWFEQRAGLPLSPAAALLLSTTGESVPAEFHRRLVMHVGTALQGDGLMQWPQTRALIHQRLGPTALAVLEADAEKLGKLLAELGWRIRFEAG
ncbi:MAG: helicase-associated domain-containing protein [Gemmataceae bacterium]|nr:helicase-associated domain-containing protein [Gemmataceae bacterium]